MEQQYYCSLWVLSDLFVSFSFFFFSSPMLTSLENVGVSVYGYTSEALGRATEFT